MNEGPNMLIGYARTSTLERAAGLGAQRRELAKAGCNRIFLEHVSSVTCRDELDAAIDYLQEGDTLVVTKLDRLASPTRHLGELVDVLEAKDAKLHIINLDIDTSSPIGKMFGDLLRSMSETDINLLNDVKATREYSAGEVIYAQGEECHGVYYLEHGLVGQRKLDADGNSLLIRLCGASEIIGYRAFLSRSNHRLTAEALMPARVCFIERSLVQRFLKLNPSLVTLFMDRALSDLTRTEDRFLQSATKSALARAIHTLLVLYERFGQETEAGEYILDLPFSRRDLAALIGIVPESMSRTIRRLETENIAHFKGRRVLLHDVETLSDQIGLTY